MSMRFLIATLCLFASSAVYAQGSEMISYCQSVDNGQKLEVIIVEKYNDDSQQTSVKVKIGDATSVSVDSKTQPVPNNPGLSATTWTAADFTLVGYFETMAPTRNFMAELTTKSETRKLSCYF